MALFQPTALFRGAEYITPEYLRGHGIRALILDVDNTLTGPRQPAAAARHCRLAANHEGKRRAAARGLEQHAGRVRPFAQKIGLPYSALCCKPSALRAVARVPRDGRAPLRGGPCGRPGVHRRPGRKPGRGENAAGAAHVSGYKSAYPPSPPFGKARAAPLLRKGRPAFVTARRAAAKTAKPLEKSKKIRYTIYTCEFVTKYYWRIDLYGFCW